MLHGLTVLTLHCTPLQAIKTGSEGRSRNEAARVGTPALFLDKVKLLSQSDYNSSRAQTLSHVNQIGLQHYLPYEH